MQSFIAFVAVLWMNQWILFVCLFVHLLCLERQFSFFFSISICDMCNMLFFMKTRARIHVFPREKWKKNYLILSVYCLFTMNKANKPKIYKTIDMIHCTNGFDIYYKMDKLTTPEYWIAFFFNFYHFEMIDRYPEHNALNT